MLFPKINIEKAKFGFCLFAFTTILTFVVFTLNITRSNILYDMNILSWIYYIPTALGQASLFALAMYLVFYLPFIFLFKNYKIATSIYISAASIMQTILIIDNFVFTLYKFHLNGFVLELLVGGGNEIFIFDFWLCIKFCMLILFATVLPYIAAFYISKRIFNKLNRRKITSISLALVLCIAISHIGHAVAAARRQTSIQKSATALPLFFPLTMNSLLYKLGVADKDSLENISHNTSSSDIQYPLQPLQIADSIPKYNIVYITIDSWNPRTFDSINCPNIWKFAQRGHSFNNHHSSGKSTRASIFGLFFGITGAYEKDFTIAKISPLLIDRLINCNYTIQTFPSAVFSTPPFHEIIFRKVKNINVKSEGNTPLERDSYITNKFTKYLNEIDKEKPFFSFLFYDLPHAISMPKKFQKKFQPSWEEADYLKLNNDMDPTQFFNLYRNCIYYTDSLVGNVIKEIENKGLLNKTVIIITGDHGQEFNENKKNYWGHSGNFSKWQTQVPFIIYYPRINPEQHYKHMTTHYDITPTVMGKVLGVKNPPEDYSMGHNLYDTKSRYPHVVGNSLDYGFIFEDKIITTTKMGRIEITDKELNELPRSVINAKELQEAINLKNKFYK